MYKRFRRDTVLSIDMHRSNMRDVKARSPMSVAHS